MLLKLSAFSILVSINLSSSCILITSIYISHLSHCSGSSIFLISHSCSGSSQHIDLRFLINNDAYKRDDVQLLSVGL